MMEKTGFAMLAIAVFLYMIGLVIALIIAFPVGLVGLLALGGMTLLFFQAVSDRFNNDEDNYYSKNVDQ